MPLETQRPVIKASILKMIKDTSEKKLEEAQEFQAEQLTSIIIDAIKSAQIIIQPGIAVTVAVPAGTGVTTAPSQPAQIT